MPMDSRRIFNLFHVDDDENERFFLSQAVGKTCLPIRLTAASNATDALACLCQSSAEARPDLVLLDIRMPMMSGFELLENLQASNDPRFAVMMFSNSSEPQDVQRARELGAIGYLVKPESTDELPAMLHRLYDQFTAGHFEGLWPVAAAPGNCAETPA
jgi:CheY-like chemotaxis protein